MTIVSYFFDNICMYASVILSSFQLILTCSKSKMENTRAMYEICSKLAIKIPWQPNLNQRYSELHDFKDNEWWCKNSNDS